MSLPSLRDLPRLQALLADGTARGEQLGGQISWWRGGRLAGEIVFGEDSPGRALTPDHAMAWLSAGKPLTAVALWQQVEEGRIELDAAVADYLPEFAVHGKERIRVRHLLTHTAGIRGADLAWTPRPWDEALAAVCAVRPEPGWTPGEKAGYHVDSLATLQGELVRRVTGVPIDAYLQERVFRPAEMADAFLALPEAEAARRAERVARLYDTSRAHAEERQVYRSPAALHYPRPGGGLRGPARDLARFYGDLLRPVPRLLSAASVAALGGLARDGMYDHTFRHVLDWGLGAQRSSNRHGRETAPYGFGRHCSDATFGHCGNQCAAAFADPVADLAVVLLLNGQPGDTAHQRRMRDALSALYEDLGLAAGV
jgi:CubicO group peptidase (beta-lactamase class C family)